MRFFVAARVQKQRPIYRTALQIVAIGRCAILTLSRFQNLADGLFHHARRDSREVCACTAVWRFCPGRHGGRIARAGGIREWQSSSSFMSRQEADRFS